MLSAIGREKKIKCIKIYVQGKRRKKALQWPLRSLMAEPTVLNFSVLRKISRVFKKNSKVSNRCQVGPRNTGLVRLASTKLKKSSISEAEQKSVELETKWS